MSIFKREYEQKINLLLEQIRSLKIELPKGFNPLTDIKLINQAEGIDYQILDSIIELYHLGKVDHNFATEMFSLLKKMKQEIRET